VIKISEDLPCRRFIALGVQHERSAEQGTYCNNPLHLLNVTRN
jgi:hypothetical protein